MLSAARRRDNCRLQPGCKLARRWRWPRARADIVSADGEDALRAAERYGHEHDVQEKVEHPERTEARETPTRARETGAKATAKATAKAVASLETGHVPSAVTATLPAGQSASSAVPGSLGMAEAVEVEVVVAALARARALADGGR